MENIIKIENLTKRYGKARGIDNINLEIEEGTIYGFIGQNGAGKSTTIKCIMNFLNKNVGKIYIDGKLVNNKNYKIKEEIGYLPSEIYLYNDLTVEKMLKYSESFYKKDCAKRKNELIELLELDVTKKIDELSLGNLKKVGIILALMHEPKVVIMDEATSGLDPLMQEKFYEILEAEKKKGTTIFFSSHILSEVKRICDKVAIIKEGKIIKIEDMSNFDDSAVLKVKIFSKQVDKIVEELQVKLINADDVKKREDEELQFIYKKDINDLIKIIFKFEIEKLIIEELELEEIFMHYYK